MHQLNLWLFPLLLLSSGLIAAAEISQTVNNEGMIEFSNHSANNNAASTIIYKTRSDNIILFSDNKPSQSEYEVLRYDCFACQPDSLINWHKVKLNTIAYAETISTIASANHVDPALVRALIHAESAFKAKALSAMGAQGLMQLMPATAKHFGVSDAFNPQQNIQAGVKYLAQLLLEFDGKIDLATAAYNAGPNAVKKYQGIPPYKETQVYVQRVNILHQRYKQVI